MLMLVMGGQLAEDGRLQNGKMFQVDNKKNEFE
jgi:hypothetical protein